MLCDFYVGTIRKQERKTKNEITNYVCTNIYYPILTCSWRELKMSESTGNFDGKVLYNVVPYPLGGMIYYAETSAEDRKSTRLNSSHTS